MAKISPLSPPPLVRQEPGGLVWHDGRGPWYRSSAVDFKDNVLYFGAAANYRWDCPDGDYGIMYAAEFPEGAYIETVQLPVGKILSLSFVKTRCMAQINLKPGAAPLHCIDLTGPGLAKIGVDSRLCTGNHMLAQQWSRYFYEHYPRCDGIRYLARHDPQQVCVAVFDRAAARIQQEPRPAAEWRAFPTPWTDWPRHYGHTLVDDLE